MRKDFNIRSLLPFPWVSLAFFLSFIYWFYLACTSQMIVVYDAINFKDLGKMLADEGWISFFRAGPNREPLYPLLISVAMGLANFFRVSYASMLILLQGAILLTSQRMLLSILRRLRIRASLCALMILYFGLSPAIMNSALSGYSEILTYPFVLGIVFALLEGQEALAENNPWRIVRSGVGVGLCAILLSLVKGAYEYVFPIFLFPLMIRWFFAVSKKDIRLIRNLGVFLLGAMVFFYGPVTGYKWLNKTYNGQYILTSRGTQVIYHSAALRSQTYDFGQLQAAVLSIPGQDFCPIFLSQEKCNIWTTGHLESFGDDPLLLQDLSKRPKAERDNYLVSLAVRKIFEKPIQFILFMIVDAAKLFFWESTGVGFVVYPDWLAALFHGHGCREIFRFGMGAFSFFAFFSNLAFIYARKGQWFKFDEDSGNVFVILMILWLMFLHISFYSFCAAFIPRHALAIAPLFLILGAFSITHATSGWKIRSRNN